MVALTVPGCWSSEKTSLFRGSGKLEARLHQRSWTETQAPTHGEFFATTWYMTETTVEINGRSWIIERTGRTFRSAKKRSAKKRFELRWTSDERGLLVSYDAFQNWLLVYIDERAPTFFRGLMLPERALGGSATDLMRKVLIAHMRKPSDALPAGLDCFGCRDGAAFDPPIWPSLRVIVPEADAEISALLLPYAARRLLESMEPPSADEVSYLQAMSAEPELKRQLMFALNWTERAGLASTAIAATCLLEAKPEDVFQASIHLLLKVPYVDESARTAVILLGWNIARAAQGHPGLAESAADDLAAVARRFASDNHLRRIAAYAVHALAYAHGRRATSLLEALAVPTPDVVAHLEAQHTTVDNSARLHLPERYSNALQDADYGDLLHDWAKCALRSMPEHR
jgi:hypothetical protein